MPPTGNWNEDVTLDKTHGGKFKHLAKRQHLLTKQGIANLRRKVLDRTKMRHADDATSVQMIVKELQNETFDPVLIYKPQHVKT